MVVAVSVAGLGVGMEVMDRHFSLNFFTLLQLQ